MCHAPRLAPLCGTAIQRMCSGLLNGEAQHNGDAAQQKDALLTAYMSVSKLLKQKLGMTRLWMPLHCVCSCAQMTDVPLLPHSAAGCTHLGLLLPIFNRASIHSFKNCAVLLSSTSPYAFSELSIGPMCEDLG